MSVYSYQIPANSKQQTANSKQQTANQPKTYPKENPKNVSNQL
jgi:hypothetical protein